MEFSLIHTRQCRPLSALISPKARGGRLADPARDFAVPQSLQEAGARWRWFFGWLRCLDHPCWWWKIMKTQMMMICLVTLLTWDTDSPVNFSAFLQFRAVRNDKIVTTAAIKFMAHLVNQKAASWARWCRIKTHCHINDFGIFWTSWIILKSSWGMFFHGFFHRFFHDSRCRLYPSCWPCMWRPCSWSVSPRSDTVSLWVATFHSGHVTSPISTRDVEYN